MTPPQQAPVHGLTSPRASLSPVRQHQPLHRDRLHRRRDGWRNRPVRHRLPWQFRDTPPHSQDRWRVARPAAWIGPLLLPQHPVHSPVYVIDPPDAFVHSGHTRPSRRRHSGSRGRYIRYSPRPRTSSPGVSSVAKKARIRRVFRLAPRPRRRTRTFRLVLHLRSVDGDRRSPRRRRWCPRRTRSRAGSRRPSPCNRT